MVLRSISRNTFQHLMPRFFNQSGRYSDTMLKNTPETIIIIGAGVFGLSTALAIACRYPSIKVIIVDRLTPPVEDGTSVDTTRCIRSDYADPVYAKLAAEAQQNIENDPELAEFYFKQGMSFIVDGKPGPMMDFWRKGLASVSSQRNQNHVVEMHTAKAVYKSIHGQDGEPVPEKLLNRERKWRLGYCNKEDAFIDAKECIRLYYERCLARPSVSFQCGVAVERLCISNGRATGVMLEDGRVLSADLTLVAAGAWSNKLVDLEGLAMSSAIEVAWIKLTEEEVAKWKNMSITTNLSTGFNIFPPYNGEIKCLRRSAGYRNTVSIQHPEDSSKLIKTSLPRTHITNPGDSIPAEAEAALRDNLREIMPQLADRPFDRTKLCW